MFRVGLPKHSPRCAGMIFFISSLASKSCPACCTRHSLSNCGNRMERCSLRHSPSLIAVPERVPKHTGLTRGTVTVAQWRSGAAWNCAGRWRRRGSIGASFHTRHHAAEAARAIEDADDQAKEPEHHAQEECVSRCQGRRRRRAEPEPAAEQSAFPFPCSTVLPC